MRISDWSSDVCSSDLDFDIRVIDRNMADILIHQHAGCAVLAFDAVADRRQLLLFFRSDIGAKKSVHGNTFLQMVCETFAVTGGIEWPCALIWLYRVRGSADPTIRTSPQIGTASGRERVGTS